MATTTTKIGFVGLGHMGGNMAARFLAAGHTVYDESRERGDANELVHEELQWRDTPREVAEASDVLITSLPNDDVLESVASGHDGVLAGLAEPKVWIGRPPRPRISFSRWRGRSDTNDATSQRSSRYSND
jgi:3-hydroxyisobutyrate dehydrogenase-like beta-hydroxyacid dehydrogenase